MTLLSDIQKQGTWKFIVPFLSFIFIIISCDKKGDDTPYKKDSTGPINQISVFSSEEVYKEISNQLNDSLLFGKVFPGLYYPPEAMFATRHFESNLFHRFKFTRLVLKIEKGNPSIVIEKDKYSKPQGYVEVKGNNTQEITQILQQNQDSIINLYRWADRTFLLNSFEEKTKAKTPELDALGVSMLIPKDFKLVESNSDFIWYRKDEINTITNRNANNDLINKSSEDILNILVYKVPYNKDSLTLEEAIKVSDSITALHIEGAKAPQIEYIGKDSLQVEVKDYVQVEKNPMLRDFYDFKALKNTTLPEYETQGYWSMTLSQMGGPYTIKAILDKKTHTLYIAEAILFAPLNQGKSKKRDYLTQMEGLFTTFKINK